MAEDWLSKAQELRDRIAGNKAEAQAAPENDPFAHLAPGYSAVGVTDPFAHLMMPKPGLISGEKVKPTLSDEALDVVKTTPSALTRGLATTFGAPGDIGHGMRWLWDQARQAVGNPASPEYVAGTGRFSNPFDVETKDVVNRIEQATGPLYQPKYGPGRFANTIGEFAGGSIAPSAGAIAKGAEAYPVIRNALISAFGGGTSAETAKEFGAGPIVQTVAGLAGGVGLSGALATAGAARRYATTSLANANNPEGAAINKIGDKLAEGGIDPAKMAQDYAANPQTPLSVMDLAKMQGEGRAMPLSDTARAAANVSPQPDAIQGLMDRRANQAGRVRGIINNATGGAGTIDQIKAAEAALPGRAVDVVEREYPGQSLEQAISILDAQTKAQAKANYAKIHAQPDVPIDDKLASIILNPKAKPHWNEAVDLAESEGETIPSWDELAKNFGKNPKSGLGLNTEGTAGTGLEAEGKYNLRQMQLEDQIAAANKAAKSKDPEIAARGAERAAELEKVKKGTAASWETKSTGQYPNAPSAATGGATVPVKAFDYFQRALRLNAQGATTNGTLRNVLNNNRQRLIEALDPANPQPGQQALVPGFRDTMGSYRAGMEGQEALQAGSKLPLDLKGNYRESLSDFAKMSDPQKDLFRIGVARNMQDFLQSGDTEARIGKLLQPGAQKVIGQVFEPDVAQRMIMGLHKEAMNASAMRKGMEIGKNLGADARETLYEFNRMTPHQQDLARKGFAQNLLDRVTNKENGPVDVAKQFKSGAAQEMIRGLYPPHIAEPLIQKLSTEAVTPDTLQALFGNSTTAKQSYNIGKELEPFKAGADLVTGRWQKLIGRLSDRLALQMNEKGAAEVTKAIATTNPAKVPELLQRLAASAQTAGQRQAYVQALSQARSIVPTLAGQYAANMAQ